jgi:ubiquinone/menaquinone biosynthesis C-methylase UbiE
LPVQVDRWVTDQIFLKRLNNPSVGRPTFLGSALAMLASIWRAIRTLWSEVRTDRVLELYREQNRAHYAKGGRGYINLEHLSREQCSSLFAGLTSRLQQFLADYPVTIGYQNGDSFLDAGCGKGQNLKYVSSAYPQSPYIGFDIDERCLQIAQVGASGSEIRSLRQGSILDPEFLKTFADKSIDHVFVSHVFSTLLEASAAQTRALHQRVVDELVRIARKSVFIIDEMSLETSLHIRIEQRTRAIALENVMAYFAKHRASGEPCILTSQESRALLFRSTRD